MFSVVPSTGVILLLTAEANAYIVCRLTVWLTLIYCRIIVESIFFYVFSSLIDILRATVFIIQYWDTLTTLCNPVYFIVTGNGWIAHSMIYFYWVALNLRFMFKF